MPETSTPYTVRVYVSDGAGQVEAINSAPYRYDIPGDAIKEWSTRLERQRVLQLRLSGAGGTAWALIPVERVVRIHLMPDRRPGDGT